MKLSKKAIASVTATIADLVSRDGAFDQEVHNVAVQILGHVSVCGDLTLMCRLLGNVTTSNGAVFEKGVASRRLALLEWLNEYSPIRVSGDNVIGMLKKTAKDYRPFDLEAAAANPFWTLSGEQDRRDKPPVPFDSATIQQSLGALNNRLTKAIEEGRVNPDMIETYKAAITQLNGSFAKITKELKLDPVADKKARDGFVATTTANEDTGNDTPEAVTA